MWCTNDGKWAVSGGEEEKTNIPCEQNNVYIVAITLNEGNIVFYADWEMMENTQKEKIGVESADTKLHFYFGVDRKKEAQQQMKVM